ncbi:MAG: hypothetical protein AAFQ91_17375 [Cyanobacteria bacterium J06621_15]
MGNTNNQKINRNEISSILQENKQGCFYDLWKYDTDNFKFENQKGQKKYNLKCLGNEIFACCLIATILIINIGGSALIRNRTKQQLIYSTTPQTSSTIHQ